MPLHHPAQNDLLAALPTAELERLRPDLEVVPMPPGRVVHDDATRPEYAYFPTSCIVALLHAANDAGKAAIVGHDGLAGFSAPAGSSVTTAQAVVQSSGYAYRLRADVLARELRSGGILRRRVLGCTQALIAQMARTAACRRRHALEQQLCRWLLLSADRSRGRELAVTLDLMERILGTPRERIVHALARLQARGLVDSRRGAIEVLDRDGLEDTACECYGATLRDQGRLLDTGFAMPRAADRRPVAFDAVGFAPS